MQRKTVELLREVRLWTTQIILPGTLLVTTIMGIPEVRYKTKSTIKKVKSKFNKEREIH